MREGVPFSLKSLEDIISEEKEELLSLIYEEVEDDLNYRVKLDIDFFFARLFDCRESQSLDWAAGLFLYWPVSRCADCF